MEALIAVKFQNLDAEKVFKYLLSAITGGSSCFLGEEATGNKRSEQGLEMGSSRRRRRCICFTRQPLIG